MEEYREGGRAGGSCGRQAGRQGKNERSGAECGADRTKKGITTINGRAGRLVCPVSTPLCRLTHPQYKQGGTDGSMSGGRSTSSARCSSPSLHSVMFLHFVRKSLGRTANRPSIYYDFVTDSSFVPSSIYRDREREREKRTGEPRWSSEFRH